MESGPRRFFPLYIRNVVFGVEDSLVSTVALLSGIAAAGVPSRTLFLTGMVLILVEAFSMASGSYLSEQSAEEYVLRKEAPMKHFIFGSVLMFFSYFFSGLIPLLPYLFFEITYALLTSVVLSFVGLFVLGALSAEISKVNVFRSGVRMFLIGGVAVILGTLVGFLLK